MLNTPVTPPRVPIIDPRTNLIDRAWYLFFVSLSATAGAYLNDPDVGPSPESLIASYDAALRALAQDTAIVPAPVNLSAELQALAQEIGTQLTPADLSAELVKQIETVGITDTGLLSMIAELQKQIDAMNSLPPPAQGTVTAVSATAPVVSSGGIAPNLSMAAANTSTDGYLTSTDWSTFNGKAPATSGTSILYGNGSGGFSNVTIGTGVSFAAGTLSATGSGGTVTSVTGTAPVVSSGGATPAISMAAASISTNGYLTSTDWNTFNGKGSGTVTAVSVVSTNGFAGTSSGGATPALTLSTTITGLLKGNGTAISAATAGTDYLVPSAPVTYTANFSVATTDVWVINNKSGSSCTATLPAASSYTGRILRFQNYQAQTLISASSNVVPLVGGAAGTAILAAVAGDTATLVSDGSNWIMTQYTPNNILLLE
jgi:hypothetical protein